jgi:hypothetical protein
MPRSMRKVAPGLRGVEEVDAGEAGELRQSPAGGQDPEWDHPGRMIPGGTYATTSIVAGRSTPAARYST